MKIAVMHLTRMQPGFVCVAGVNVADRSAVRPVAPRGRLRDTMCARRGGPFDMATVVDVGQTRPVGCAPEVEDHEFSGWQARAVQAIEPGLFWELLTFLARPSLRELFGPDLRKAGRDRAIVDAGHGHASLGCLLPARQPALYVTVGCDGRQRPRLRLNDGQFDLDLSVTDLRLYGPDQTHLDMEAVDAALYRLDHEVPILLSVGLTRPFASREGEEPVHWLQVNNLHFEDDAGWRLSAGEPAAAGHSAIEDDNPEDLPF